MKTVLSEREQAFKGLAGLTDGQKHPLPVSGTKGSSWYTAAGHWFGWGDLSHEQMEAMARTLLLGEMVIVLPAEDAYYRFLKQVVPVIDGVAVSDDAPARKYLTRHAIFIIVSSHIVLIDEILTKRGVEKVGDLCYEVIDRAAAERIISWTELCLESA